MSDEQKHLEVMNRFIDLANAVKDEGVDMRIVSAGLMSACAVYATYAAAGNQGRLAPSGVEKVTDAFRQQLERVQDARAAEMGEGQGDG